MGLGTSSPENPSPTSNEHQSSNISPQGTPIAIPRIKQARNEAAIQSTPEMHIVGSPLTIENQEEGTEGGGGALVTTVFKWTNGGKELYISGTFNEWKEKLAMKASHGDFTTIVALPPGKYYYKYIVDGEWQTDPTKPTETDVLGNLNNVLEITPPDEEESSILSQPPSGSPPGPYGQAVWDPLQSANLNQSNPNKPQGPPILPPHLMRALLNTTSPDNDPSRLPLPHHVMLNHLYSLPRREDNTIILGITQRYRQKFVTTVIYKNLESKDQLNNSIPIEST